MDSYSSTIHVWAVKWRHLIYFVTYLLIYALEWAIFNGIVQYFINFFLFPWLGILNIYKFLVVSEFVLENSHNCHKNSVFGLTLAVKNKKIAGNKTNKLLSINNGGIDRVDWSDSFVYLEDLCGAIKERKQLEGKW